MIVSIDWLKQLVNLKVPIQEVINLLPLQTIGTKEVTDKFIELDMKGYNRPDLLSMRGVAIEVAAITNSSLNFSEVPEDEYIWLGQNLPNIKIEIIDQKNCPNYCLAKIENLKVSPSDPDWVKRLDNSGMRSINNVTDVTNLMMLEWGQPMHAFDASKITQQKIIVRNAKGDEKIKTLDGKVRALNPTNLVIADPEKILGIAGVMGGEDSQITNSTSTIFLEAAIFDPISIRVTSQELGLPSEASKRFQHGLTKTNLLQSLNQAIRLYEQMGGKLTALTLIGNFEDIKKEINLNYGKIKSLIGIEIPQEEIENSLKKLHFELSKTNSGWKVSPPYFRQDIENQEDVIEEIARLYGYEKIPAQPLEGVIPAPIDQKLQDLIFRLKQDFKELGLTEIDTDSFFSVELVNKLDLNENTLVKIANPISAETKYLRNTLWMKYLNIVSENLKYRDEVAGFTVGKIYLPEQESLPKEEYKLSLVLANDSLTSLEELFTILKHEFEQLKQDLQVKENPNPSELFHPVRYRDLYQNNQKIGFIGEIHPRVTFKFGINKKVAVVEIKF